LRKSADNAIDRGDYAAAITDAEDAVEISALYMHIGFAIRPRDEREGLREFNRETGEWYQGIEQSYREARRPPANLFAKLFGRG
jgi:HEPN domain-containing protein